MHIYKCHNNSSKYALLFLFSTKEILAQGIKRFAYGHIEVKLNLKTWSV